MQKYNESVMKLDPNYATSIFDIFTNLFSINPVPEKPCNKPSLPQKYNYFSFNSSATNADMITQQQTGFSNATTTLQSGFLLPTNETIG